MRFRQGLFFHKICDNQKNIEKNEKNLKKDLIFVLRCDNLYRQCDEIGMSCSRFNGKEVCPMSVWEYILGAALIVISLVLIVIVIMQQSKQQGLSGAIAGGADTFFGKNKGRTIEAKLEKLTKILCAVFVILTLVTTILVGFFA